MTKRERLLAFGVGATLGLWALSALVVDPALEAWNDASDALTAAELENDESRSVVDSRFIVERKRTSYQRAGMDQDIVSAGLGLQAQINAWSQEAKVTLEGMSTAGVVEDDGFWVSRLSVSLTGSAENMLHFMRLLEAAPMPLSVTNSDFSRRDVDKADVNWRLTVSTIVEGGSQ